MDGKIYQGMLKKSTLIKKCLIVGDPAALPPLGEGISAKKGGELKQQNRQRISYLNR